MTEIRVMANLREIAMTVVSGVTELPSVQKDVIIITAETTEEVTVEKGKWLHYKIKLSNLKSKIKS